MYDNDDGTITEEASEKNLSQKNIDLSSINFLCNPG